MAATAPPALSWPSSPPGVERRVLFYRDFRQFTGGHLKVWHYFEHVRHTPGFRPLIAFSKETRWDQTNPWWARREEALAHWDPQRAEVLFLAGMDWLVLPEAERQAPPRPVINLIQHVRHAHPAEALYRFLPYPAVRICVSPEVAAALQATGRVNGPVVTLPNGIDLAALPAARPWRERERRVLILGIKRPIMAAELRDVLGEMGLAVDCLLAAVPRAAFLRRLAEARLAVLLPDPTEGFYLPALEAMALGTPVVCPDAIGNRSFCVPDMTCWQPGYSVKALREAVDHVLHLPEETVQAVMTTGQAMARRHSLAQEREAFIHLLRGLA